MDKVCFLQVKAFGDFVIAAAAVERVRAVDRSRVIMATGEHLRPLSDAIMPPVPVVELATAETGVPSIFDVRRNGLRAAIRSAWNVRRAIARAPLGDGAVILMDHIGPRERFIIGDHPAAGFRDGTDNIYTGYETMLVDAGFTLVPIAKPVARKRQRIGIFPGSRIAAKNLSPDLVARVLTQAKRDGVEAELFLLDGERPDLERGNLPHTLVPRQFSALYEAIRGVDMVVSADSLPAHLAERAGVDVFVFTPRPNPFWMPPSVIRENRWGLFEDPAALPRFGAALTG